MQSSGASVMKRGLLLLLIVGVLAIVTSVTFVGTNILSAKQLSLFEMAQVGDREGVAFVCRWDPKQIEMRNEMEVGFMPHSGATALHVAGDVMVAQSLIDAGIDVNAQTDDGATPLYYAAELNRLQILQLLLSEGADPNIPNRIKDTPIARAAIKGNADAVSLLLEAGADGSYQDFDGWTLLHHAASGGHVDVIRVLVANRCDYSAVDRNGQNALHIASITNQVEAARVLLEAGVDSQIRDNNGRTPVEVARSDRMRALFKDHQTD